MLIELVLPVVVVFPCAARPSASRRSFNSAVPCIRRLTPRGRPRHDDRLIELSCGQCCRIAITADCDTDEPHRFRWLYGSDTNQHITNCQ